MRVERKRAEHWRGSWDYFAAGEGKTALLAFAGSLGACETLARVLTELAPHHRVLAPAYSPVANLAEMFEGVDAILKTEGISADVLYGGSFGGMLAQCWLRRHPDHVKRVVLSGCDGPDPSRAPKNQKWRRRMQFFPMSVMRLALKFALRKLMRDVTRDHDAWRNDYLKLIAGLQRRDLESRYLVSIDFDENCRFTVDDLKDWPGKMLILEGGADRVAHPKIRANLRALYPRAQVHTISEAGHGLLLSHPDQIIQIVRPFI